MEEKVLEILKKENQKLRKICLSDKKLEELRNDFLKNNPRFFKEEDVRTYFKIILQKAIQDDPNGLLAKKLIGPYKQLYLKFHNRFNLKPSENTYSIFSKICLNVMLNYEKDTPIDSIILKIYQKEVLKFNILRKNTNENLSLNEDTFLTNINYDVAYRLRDYFKVYLNDYYSILVKVHGTNFNENNVILKDEMDIYNTAKKVFLKKYNSTLTSPSLIQKYNISYSKIMSFLEKMKNDNLEYYQIFKEVYGLTFQDNYGILLDKMEIFEEAKEYFENIMYEMTSDQIYKISCRYEKKYIIDLLNYYKKNKKEDYSILIMAHGKKFDEQNKVWNKEYYKTIRNFYQDLKEKTMLFESVFEYDKNEILNLLSTESKNKYFKIIKKRFGTDLCSCQILENEKEYSLLKEAFVYIEKEILSYKSLFKHVDKEDIWSRLEYFHVFFKEYEDIIVKVHGKSLDELNFLTKEEKSIYMDAVGIIMKSVQSRERKLNVLLSTEESVLNNVLEFLKSNANEYYVILQKKFGLRFNEVYSLNKADKILYKEALEYLKTLIKRDKRNNIFAKFSDDVLQREMKYLKYFYPDYAFALERIHGESLKEEILDMKFDNVYKNACNFVLKDLEENGTCLLEKISLLQLDFNEVMSFVNDEETELLKKKYGFDFDDWYKLGKEHGALLGRAILYLKNIHLNNHKNKQEYFKQIKKYDNDLLVSTLKYLEKFYFLESKTIIKVFGRNFDKQNEENINNSSMEIFIKFLNAKKFDINEIIPVRNDIFGLFVSHLSIREQDIIQKKYGLDYNKEYFLDNGEENILKRAVEKLRVFYEEYKKMNSLLPEIINFKKNNIDFLKKYFENRLDVMTILNKLEDVGEILKLYSPSQILEVLQDVKEVSNSSINVSYEIRKIVDIMWEKRKYLFDSEEMEKLFIDGVVNQLNEIKESELQNFELEEFVKEKLNEDYTLRNKLWTYFIPVFNDFLEENRLKTFQEYEEIFMNNVLYFVLSDLDEIDLVDNIHDKTLKDILELEKKKNRVLLEGVLKNNPKDVLRKSLNDVLKTELAYYNILTLYIDGNLNYRDSNKYSFEHYRASMFLKNVVFHNINLSSIDEIERYAKKINRIGLLRFSVQQIRELATNFYNKYENDIKKLSVLEKQDKFKKYFCEQIMFEIFENQNEEMLRNIIDCYLYIYNNINALYNVKDTLNERKIFVNICIICNLYRKDSDSVTKKISNLYKKQVIKSQVNVKKKENNLQITVQQVLQINHKKMLNPLKKVINLLPNNEKGQLNEIFSFEKHHNIIYKMDLILKMYGLVFLVTGDLDHELSILLQKDDLILEYQKIKEVFLEQFSLESFKKCQNYNEHLLEIFVGDVK